MGIGRVEGRHRLAVTLREGGVEALNQLRVAGGHAATLTGLR
jgi:hypothetical protein